ncbi:hypothetical protein BTO09_11780 [Gilvibacter sp. SZ-19]|uniref:DUF2911 domain-containing protein n=1 Tax=Gilvibacter sp. SZ-19 TaxID=754429 RepID=UPI000B3C3CD0|nr:DUF2911 domain-containing protein [Gilvibacter sp. SZ-19]ARV12982.1 hypothetical protein BTO09_11780 [Gilvibacter sp. SZ-19]
MSKIFTHLVLGLTLLFIGAAQAQIQTPRAASPQAKVSQTIGLTEITVDYSRPSVRGREIYGTPIAHYGFQNLGFGTSEAAPWRAGANENTKITFTHDVLIGGGKVPAGTYGYFIALEENGPATVILSSNSSAWGSFFYKPSEDIARVRVTPETIDHQETLVFEFDEITANSTVLTLKWEELAFPLKIDVPVAEVVLAEARKAMQDQPGFNRQTWEQAAAYALQNNTALEEALSWIDNAIAGKFYSQKTYVNLSTKAQLLKALGRSEEADAIMAEALDLATVLEMHQYGRQLIASGQVDKAMAVFKRNAKQNPDTWPVHYGLARGYSAQGDYKQAAKHLEKALANAPNAASKARVAANLEKLKNNQDIN